MSGKLGYGGGIMCVLLAGTFWSLMGLAIKLIDSAATWQIVLYRSLGLIPVLFLFIAIRSGRSPVKSIREAGLPSVVGATGLVAAFSGGIFSIQETTVANAVFLFATAPLFTAVLAWPVLGERVGKRTWIAVGVGLVGVIVMVNDGIARGAFLGNLAAVISAIGFATFTLSLRWGRFSDMASSVLLAGVLSLAVSVAMCLLLRQSLVISAHDSAISLMMGAGLLGCGLTIYTIGSRTVPAAELALLAMTEVLLAPVWVWLVLGETAGFWTLLGGAILMSAIAGNALVGIRNLPGAHA